MYAVPKGDVKETLKQVEALGGVKARIVDHIGFGQVVRVETKQQETIKERLGALSSVGHVADHLEKKIELGLFERSERPELTESLRAVMRKARGE
jgi:hypothetical protein